MPGLLDRRSLPYKGSGQWNRITLTSLRRAGRATLVAIQLYRHRHIRGDELHSLRLAGEASFTGCADRLNVGHASRLSRR